MAGRRGFGVIESRRSKTTNKVVSARARYWGPDSQRYSQTFGDRLSAEMWLVEERRLIDRGEWRPPRLRDVVVERPTLSQWALEHIDSRTLAPATRRQYERMVRVYLDPVLGQRYIDEITVADVAAWHAKVKTDLRKRAREAKRTNGDGSGEASQVYKFVSGVFKGAVTRGLIDTSPARIVGAGRYRRHRAPQVLTGAEVQALAAALPERLHALADLLAWSGLRIGEARALRRRDLDLADVDNATVSVERNVSQGGKGVGAVVGRVKSEAGRRAVAIPRELAVTLARHVERFAQPGRDGLLFPSRTGAVLSDSTWRYSWIKARNVAGLPDIKTHDLRHTSLTMAGRAGATTAELMHRAGHTEPRVAMIYQHGSAERDRMITERMRVLMAGDELAERRGSNRARGRKGRTARSPRARTDHPDPPADGGGHAPAV